jgi:hypothetical protein
VLKFILGINHYVSLVRVDHPFKDMQFTLAVRTKQVTKDWRGFVLLLGHNNEAKKF